MVLLFSVVGVSANDLNDTLLNSDDEAIMLEQVNQTVVESTDNEVLSNDAGTFSNLQNEIDLASKGSTITLDKDYAYDEGFSKRGIKIDKDLTIDGKGHTLDGAGKSRIFLVGLGLIKNHQVTLKNINY